MKKVKNKLRIHHYPQIPCKPFIVDVKDEYEAFKVYNVLADQHLFLLEQNIIPDYSNAITVVMWDEDLDPDENGEKWTDYWNNEEGMEWHDVVEMYLKP